MTLTKKLLITVVCLSVILCVMVAGTIAWLKDNTQEITNTFTPSNIGITLTETEHGVDYKFQMIPGKTYDKNPSVTVTTDIACYVFVKVDEKIGLFTYKDSQNNDVTATFAAYLQYDMASGWIAIDGVPGVYYREVSANDTFDVIHGNTVSVPGAVTKAMMEALKTAGATNYPTLTFTAYAIQQYGFDTAADAWAELNPPAQP